MALNGFTQEHTYIAGGLLVITGLLGVYGSFSGTLAAMLASLFAPSDLRKATPNQATFVIPEQSTPSTGSGTNATPSNPEVPSIPALPEPTLPALPV